MRKLIYLGILFVLSNSLNAQNEELRKKERYIERKIASMCSQFGSVFNVKTENCTMHVYETMENAEGETDTVNYYHIDLTSIPETVYYSEKEKFGITKIILNNPGMYMISYFDILGEKTKKRTDNQVVLPFRTKNLDRIKFVNELDKYLQKIRDLCNE